MRTYRFRRAVWLLCLGLAACNGRATVDESKTESASQAAAPAKLQEMDEEQREFLWDIEHHGNILNQIAFPALAGALKQADQKALAGMFAAEFQGAVPHQPKETSIHNEFLDVVRLSDAGNTPEKLDAAQFIDRLLEIRRYFKHSVKGSKISLMKLRPTKEDNLDAPWEGTGQLRLTGEVDAGKPAEAVVYLKYRTVRPTKEAVAKGQWLLACGITQSQMGSAHHFLMREVAAERGLEPDKIYDNWKQNTFDPVTGGVYLCDFDRDGIIDVLITDRNGYFLYKGLPDGKFENVTKEMGLPVISNEASSRGMVAAWADLDGDGWEDLILGKDIFRNEKGKHFTLVTMLSNLHLPSNTGGIAVADYDGDGKLDLYVFHSGVGKADSWIEGKAGTGTGNQLWRNRGNWRFEEVTEKSRTGGEERSTFTALWLDANNDGKPDLYVPNEFGDGVLYINQGNGTFKPNVLSKSACDFGTMGATAGDIDGSGNISIYCGNMYSKAGSRVIGNVRTGTYPEKLMEKMRTFVKGSELHLNRGGLQFDQKGQEWQVNDAGWAYGPALVDLDNDGWLDIHATCGYISRDRTKPDG
jgi:hypothetical protein